MAAARVATSLQTSISKAVPSASDLVGPRPLRAGTHALRGGDRIAACGTTRRCLPPGKPGGPNPRETLEPRRHRCPSSSST